MDLSRNYFELFELEPHFDLDPALLMPVYRDLQKRLHPDNYINATESEKLLSVRWTSYLNEGLQVLKSPMRRALYLMKLWGREVDLEVNAAMTPEFLMQQMQLREELDAVEGSSDSEAALDKLLDHLAKTKLVLSERLAQTLPNRDGANFELAEDTVRRFAFLLKLEEQTGKLEAKLFD